MPVPVQLPRFGLVVVPGTEEPNTGNRHVSKQSDSDWKVYRLNIGRELPPVALISIMESPFDSMSFLTILHLRAKIQ
jgi:hypothetical protein